MKKVTLKNIYLILVISIGLIGLGIGSTYAMFTSTNKIDDPISLSSNLSSSNNIFESFDITINSKENKTIKFNITNSSNITNLNYASWYIYDGNESDITFYTSIDNTNDIEPNGILPSSGGTINIKIINNTSNTINLTIGVITNKDNIILPEYMKLISSNKEPKTTLADYITNLYVNASKTKAQNNGIDYNYASSESLMNDKLGGTTTSLDGGNIRYYGANPNNYIYFNCSDYNNQTSDTCELWRIIGVFNNQVKIMRNEYIILTTWDIDKYENEWSKSVLMKLLNPGYETSEQANGSLYYNSKSGSCYRADGGRVLRFGCDFTSTGIKNEATKSKIAIVNWNTGGSTGYKTYANVLYNAERGTAAVSSSRTTSWTGKIALPYPSDYGYAVDFTSCDYNLYYYSNCTRYNWMYKTFYTKSSIVSNWLLTPNSEKTDRVYVVGDNGGISDLQNVNDYEGVVPALFLNQEETIVDGNTGSSVDPYKLKP